MPRGSNLQRIAIGGGLLVLSIGAFALGHAVSEAFKPLPAIVPLPASAPKPVASSSLPGPLSSPLSGPAVPPAVSPTPPPAAKAAIPSVLPAPDVSSPAAISPGASSDERRAKARKDAEAHWSGKPGAVAAGATLPAANESAVATPAPEAVRPAKAAAALPAPGPMPIPANSATANSSAARSLGLLTEMKGVPEAIAAIDARKDEVASSLELLIQGVVDNRADPLSWSHLAAALDRGGQRAAAIAVANRGMSAAKRQQDGAAVTQLTQQIAQLELAGGDAKQPVAVSVKASTSGKTEPATVQAPDKLAGALDEALRNNAAAEALKILQQMAQGSIAKGDYASAQQSYNHAIKVAHLSKLGEARADQYANLGRMFLQKGDPNEAQAYWRAARDQYEQFDMTAKVAEMNTLLRQISPAALASPSRPSQSGKKTSSIIELR